MEELTALCYGLGLEYIDKYEFRQSEIKGLLKDLNSSLDSGISSVNLNYLLRGKAFYLVQSDSVVFNYSQQKLDVTDKNYDYPGLDKGMSLLVYNPKLIRLNLNKSENIFIYSTSINKQTIFTQKLASNIRDASLNAQMLNIKDLKEIGK